MTKPGERRPSLSPSASTPMPCALSLFATSAGEPRPLAPQRAPGARCGGVGPQGPPCLCVHALSAWGLSPCLPPAPWQGSVHSCRQGGRHPPSLAGRDCARPLEASAAPPGTGWPAWDWPGAPGTGWGPGALFPPAPGAPGPEPTTPPNSAPIWKLGSQALGIPASGNFREPLSGLSSLKGLPRGGPQGHPPRAWEPERKPRDCILKALAASKQNNDFPCVRMLPGPFWKGQVQTTGAAESLTLLPWEHSGEVEFCSCSVFALSHEPNSTEGGGHSGGEAAEQLCSREVFPSEFQKKGEVRPGPDLLPRFHRWDAPGSSSLFQTGQEVRVGDQILEFLWVLVRASGGKALGAAVGSRHSARNPQLCLVVISSFLKRSLRAKHPGGACNV